MTLVSHFDRGLGISLEHPDDWQVGRSAAFPLVLLAPIASGYRSNVGFSRSEPPSTSPDVLDATLAIARDQQRADYPGFEELADLRFEQDGFPARLQLYRWQPPGAAEPFTQLFGLVLTRDHGLLEINGATLRSLEASALPALEAIVRSIRFIPHGG
jgi:hypothetical protein